jgi:dTDP-4-amino-4,6-dideoxygalactose transaminase
VENIVKVPLLDLREQNAAVEPQLQEAFRRVLASGQFILGQEVEDLEKNAASLLQTKHAIAVSSGTDAILLALMALDVGPGDEVICPSFTFFATAGCIARTGAKPVFADSSPVCFNLDIGDAARRITPRTKAIMPVHLFGQSADMDAVMALAKQHNLRVIEDAAQALSTAYRGKPVGSIGDFGAYSFFPSKNLGGFGDGGMLVTSDDALAERARILRTHGAQPKYFHKVVGGNFRMDSLFAALLSVKLPHLAQYSANRRANAAYYTERLTQLPGVSLTEESGAKIVLPATRPYSDHIWNQYTLRVIPGSGWKNPGNPRDALQKFLAANDIGSEIYYPRPMHQQECFAPPAGSSAESLPVCERLASCSLSIPVFPELKREQKDAVIGAIGNFLRENALGENLLRENIA